MKEKTIKILFDARAMQGEWQTGVGHYAKKIAEHILNTNICEQISFFSNQLKKSTLNKMSDKKTINTRVPNKLLNASIAFFSKPNIEKIIKRDFDIFFAPNINFISVKPNVKLILVLHDLSFIHFPEFFSPKTRVWHKAVNISKLTKRADRIICVSDNTKYDAINTLNIDEQKISTVYPGIEQKNYTKKNISNDKYILYVGSVEKRKNVISLVQAFSKIHKKYENLKLVLAGPTGWRWQEVFNEINKSSAKHKIEYKGYVNCEEKDKLMQNAEIFVYPSLFEGFGFPPLEAMSYKIPTIASWSTSLKEILESSALLINPMISDEIAFTIEQLLTDKALYEHFSEAGFRQSQKFTWENCANKIANILEN